MRAKRLQTKLRLFYDQLEICGGNQSTRWLVWGLYTFIIIIFAYKHEPWYDEYHAWGMVNQMDFVRLWKAMRIEGHLFCGICVYGHL